MIASPHSAGTTQLLRSVTALVRNGPLAGLWLFVWVFAAQLGHLIEHIAKAITGSGLLGASLDSELSHFLFNGAIAVLAVVLIAAYPQNPWVYPLAAIAFLHGVEHAYIFEQYVRTGIRDGPGLLGSGGAIGLIPLARQELHNAYNGLETILLVLGCSFEIENLVETELPSRHSLKSSRVAAPGWWRKEDPSCE